MLNRISHLQGSNLIATDGEIGHVKEAFFDDQKWVVRYLVIETGRWLAGREVLISPYSVKQPLADDKNIYVSLTQEQVRKSPPIDTHQPVSRRHEREYLSYYAYPQYWGGSDLWALNSVPLLPAPAASSADIERMKFDEDLAAEDVHLRSSEHVTGYSIGASDDSIGHVKDFVFDDASWAIRYLIVDTRNWWPGGKKVLIATHWIDRIDWADKTVYTTLTRDQVKNSPEYDEAVPLDRDYEERLHRAHARTGYWD